MDNQEQVEAEAEVYDWCANDVARHTGMSLSWVRKKSKLGVLEYKVRGGKFRYSSQAVRAWWASYDERNQ